MILDQHGHPIRRETLIEPQTSPLAWLHRELPSHPSRGLTPARLAQILDGAENGDSVAQFELFSDMEERDAHLAAEMDKRRRACAQLEWDLVAPEGATSAEVDIAKRVKDWILQIPGFDQVLFDATDGIGKGFAAIEHEWGYFGGAWRLREMFFRPQTWFQFHRAARREEIRLRDNSGDGAVLNAFGWTLHQVRARSGWLSRTALMRALAIPYMLKVYGVGFLAEFVEIYGIPVRVGYYPQGASNSDRSTLKSALAHIGRSAAGIVPDGMRLEFEEAAKGDADPFAWLIDWCERSVSKLILGATLTSGADRGSNTNALGNIHNEVRLDIRDSDAKGLATTLTRDLVWPLCAINGLVADQTRCPRWVFDTGEAEELTAMSLAIPRLVRVGMKITEDWAHDQLRIPKPKEGQVVLSPPLWAQGAAATELAAARALPPPTASSASGADAQRQAQLVDWIERESGKAMDEWIDEIRELVESAPSLEAIQSGLAELVTDGLPAEALGELMTQALGVANLLGRDAARTQARA